MNNITADLGSRKIVASKLSNCIIWIAVVSVFCISIHFGDEMRDSVVHSFRICTTSIIPSVFPYMILCDFISHIKSDSGSISRIISRIYGIHPLGSRAVLLGNVFGFPIGARSAVSLYNQGTINKSECARIAGLSTNPSLSFVVFVTGAAMRGSITEGYILYFSTFCATLLAALITRNTNAKCDNNAFIYGQKFNLISSIQSAASACITLIACVALFSCTITLCDVAINNVVLTAIVSMLLEIGNATATLSALTLPDATSFALTATALGFSGISVHMQIESVLPPEIPRAIYYRLKLTEALLSGIIAYLFYTVCQALSII